MDKLIRSAGDRFMLSCAEMSSVSNGEEAVIPVEREESSPAAFTDAFGSTLPFTTGRARRNDAARVPSPDADAPGATALPGAVHRLTPVPIAALGDTVQHERGRLVALAAPARTRRTTGSDPRRYVIQRELARGSTSRISLAEDTHLHRTVALKEPLVPIGDLAARFERELALTSRLQHPSIVSIHDGGVWPSGAPYYVMKLVTGESLEKVIGACSTAAERMALLPHGIAVADALAYAHDAGIVHGDLEPANVLVGTFGETVVIDWELAKELRDPADARADVYSLGALLYHLLSGESPSNGRTTAVVPLAEKSPGVPPALSAIIAKAIAPQAEDRHASAVELAAELRRYQSNQLAGAHAPARGRLRRWLRKHRTAIGVASVALGTLAVLGAMNL